uniref:Uncharacterized protein n=1 Tax=Rhizophora mucronata TaxID=61149 RepID=A0A2P2KUV1_RHIMU
MLAQHILSNCYSISENDKGIIKQL